MTVLYPNPCYMYYEVCYKGTIGIVPITQLRTCIIKKNSNIQGRSPNVVKVIFHAKGNCF